MTSSEAHFTVFYPCNTCNTAVWVCSMARSANIHYRTHTRGTHFGNTTGLHTPVLNPRSELLGTSVKKYNNYQMHMQICHSTGFVVAKSVHCRLSFLSSIQAWTVSPEAHITLGPAMSYLELWRSNHVLYSYVRWRLSKSICVITVTTCLTIGNHSFSGGLVFSYLMAK